MKAFYHLVQFLFTILTLLALTGGFTACSENDETYDLESPSVKKLPVSISVETTLSGLGEKQETLSTLATYDYKYNEKNQLVELKTSIPLGRVGVKRNTTYSLTYSADGRIIEKRLVRDDPELFLLDVTYSYVYSAGTVYKKVKDDGYEENSEVWIPNPQKINDSGYPITAEYDEGLAKYNYEFGYDKYQNLTKYEYKFKNKRFERKMEFDASYSNMYSPYINLNLPAWFIRQEIPSIIEPTFSSYSLLGKHLAQYEQIRRIINYSESEEQDEVELNEYAYTVKKFEDNYATEIEIEVGFKYLDNETIVEIKHCTIQYKNITK